MQRIEKTLPGRRSVVRALAMSGVVSLAATLVLPSTARAFYHAKKQDTQPAVPAQGSGETVVIELNDKLKFVPAETRIKVGTTVEWRNIGGYTHTVTADPERVAKRGNVELPNGVEAFDSGAVGKGQTFSRTFTVAGVYRYVCLPHEGARMLGTVIVE